MTNEKYDEFFLDDMANLLGDVGAVLEAAEQQGRWDSAIPFLFRTFHSLKGAAPMAGLPQLGKFLHRLEDLLAFIRDGKLVMDMQWNEFLLGAITLMEGEIAAARLDEPLDDYEEQHEQLLAKLPKELFPDKEDVKSAAVTEKQHLAIIGCILTENAQMPEVAVMVLERQYQEAGEVKSMVLARDGDRQVIIGIVETKLENSELKQLACAAEVAEVVVQPLFGEAFPTLQEDNGKMGAEYRRGLKILLVDDDVDLLMLIWKALDKKGYNTVAVTTAEEALQLIDSEKFHILISDISLPGLNGLELIRFAKKRDAFMQVIVMTGLAAMQNALQALELGAAEYLVKPLVSMRELVRAVEGCEAKLAHWWLRLQEINDKR